MDEVAIASSPSPRLAQRSQRIVRREPIATMAGIAAVWTGPMLIGEAEVSRDPYD